MHLSSLRRALIVGGALLIGFAWFVWLRPTALGGSASYVVVHGHSMEPTYQDGDLVLIREAASYGEGDIIAFHAGGTFDDPTRVIHRIVGDAGNGEFNTQGDNRDEIDPWTPGAHDIIGKAVLHVPMAGNAAGFLTRPATFAALGGAAVVVGGERRRRRRRTRQPARQEATSMKHLRRTESIEAAPRPSGDAPSRVARFTHPRWAFVGLLVTCLLAVPVLSITWSALRAPDSIERIDQVGLVDAGIGVDYRFLGGKSAVYPTGEVKASPTAAGAVVPDSPLYSRLLDRLDVELAFRSTADGADELVSTYGADVTVETPSGWSTTIDRIEPTPFEESATETLGIDLRAVARQVAAVAQLTGVDTGEYTIRVTPTLDVAGPSDAGQIQKDLGAPLSFAVKGNVITASAIESSEQQPLTRTVQHDARYSVGPLEMGTQAARALLAGLSLVLVAGMAWFASVLFGGVGLGEPDRIAARYRSQIIDVAEASAPPGPVVMVGAIDELARIAKVEQTVILHEDLGDGAHRYRVFLGTVTYEYETAPEHAGAATEESADVDESGS